jgi:hypothetical protein
MHEAWTDSENDEQIEGMTPEGGMDDFREFPTRDEFYEWYNSKD